MTISRRRFLKAAGAFSLGLTGLRCRAEEEAPLPSGEELPEAFGPLVPDPSGILDLPRGFRYQVLSRTGELMSDGLYVPGRPDGMAAFERPGGRVVLVRNHELNLDDGPDTGPFGPENHLRDRVSPSMVYDVGTDDRLPLGGTTTLVYDPRRRDLVEQRLSLVGTLRNCAGGPTPWNTWLSCEESVAGAGARPFVTRDHGYLFEVPADPSRGAFARPLRAMGRFYREAVAVDPDTSIVYQTEDLGDGLIYRFIPSAAERLADGGRLQALAVRGRPGLRTQNWDGREVAVRRPLEVSWVDLEDVESEEGTLRSQGFEKGAAQFARAEGMWWGDGVCFFACTNGGEARKGQIWKYTPGEAEGTPEEASEPGLLELFVEPNDGTLVENADNLTVAPWGDLVVCEDGTGEDYLVGITPDGGIYKLGRNRRSNGELAGATFSPDGSTLFLNLQLEGLTVAITGPWDRRES